jgi:hypothetical protein
VITVAAFVRGVRNGFCRPGDFLYNSSLTGVVSTDLACVAFVSLLELDESEK